jgi:hypothetical protein
VGSGENEVSSISSVWNRRRGRGVGGCPCRVEPWEVGKHMGACGRGAFRRSGMQGLSGSPVSARPCLWGSVT